MKVTALNRLLLRATGKDIKLNVLEEGEGYVKNRTYLLSSNEFCGDIFDTNSERRAIRAINYALKHHKDVGTFGVMTGLGRGGDEPFFPAYDTNEYNV